VSAAGAPLVVLSNCTAYTFHRGMRCWMCLADTAFPASAFHSSLAPASGPLLCCVLREIVRPIVRLKTLSCFMTTTGLKVSPESLPHSSSLTRLPKCSVACECTHAVTGLM